MKIFFASDHAGFEMKSSLIEFVKELGFEVEDCGAYELNQEDDYPEFIKKAAQKVSDDPENCKGIILGGLRGRRGHGCQQISKYTGLCLLWWPERNSDFVQRAQ